MHDQGKGSVFRFPGEITRAVFVLLFVMFIFAGIEVRPSGAQVESPEVDNSSQVVNSRVEDFTLLNGTAYWTYCIGDLNNYSTLLMSQQLNDPNSKTQLLEIPSTNCVVYRELASDPAYLYYINVTNSRIEKRLFQTIGSAVTIANFTTSNEPTGLALADGYLYWSAKDMTIRRVSVTGGAVQKVADTSGVPVDISIDDQNIWYGSSSGVYWMKRDCSLPCSGTRVYTTNVKQLFAAGRADPSYRQAVFWIANSKTGPETVESWDCDVPGQKGCSHKVLYQGTANFSIDGVSAGEKDVFWIEVDTNTWTSRFLRRSPRDCAQPCSAISVDKLVDPVSPNGDWLPARMLIDDVDIYFRHNGISRIAQDADPLIWQFGYDGMEVTQAIQSLSNDVPLVIDKPTYVRVYAHLSQGEDVIGPEAHLVGTYNGAALPGSPLQPVRRPQRFSVGETFDRADMQTAWLFELPREWTEKGTIVLRATIDPRKLYDSTSASSPLTSIGFTYRPPVCLVALKVSQHGPTARYTDSSFRLAVKTASVLLPASDIWVYHQGMVLEEGIWPFYSPYELPDDSGILKGNILFRDRFSDDPEECDSAGARTLYTGMIHPNTNTDGVNGSAFVHLDQSWTRLPVANNAWGVVYAGWPLEGRESTLAHELSHNFGRWHVNCPEGVPADPEFYPYKPPCLLSYPDGEIVHYGFDPILALPIGPTDASDLMSYQPPRWISDYTWKNVFNANAPIPFQGPVAEPPDMILNGTVDIGSPAMGDLDYAWVMPAGSLSPGVQEKWQRAASETFPLSLGAPRYFVRFVGIGGSILGERDINLYRSSDEGAASDIRTFNLFTTAPGGLVLKLQLMKDTTVLDTLAPGLLAPQVVVTEAMATGISEERELKVNWTANDPGGDILKFIVQFTHDQGVHWLTLGSGITGTPDITAYEAVFNAATLPGSRGLNALVRVIASDGYNTAVAYSRNFETTLKYPEPAIYSPPEGIWYDAGQPITLEGAGFDPEDGHMPGSSLQWNMNSINYGTGDMVNVHGLAPGAYDVRLKATDLDGLTATTDTAFTIAPYTIAEGRARLDGRCTDAAYAGTPVIQLAPYADGSQAGVYAVRNDRYIWFCFSGLQKGANYVNSFAGVRIDTNFSHDALAQPGDYGFFVRPGGGQFTKRGNGSGGFGDSTPSFVEYSLATRTRTDVGGNTWSAEIRIESYYAGMWDRIGIDLAHYWVNNQGNDFHWPYAAKYNQPVTWAESYIESPPSLTSAAPGTITLPKTSQVIVVTGVNFMNGDKIVWDGTVLQTTFNSAGQLSATAASGQLVAGEHLVQVLRTGAGDLKTSPLPIHVVYPVPVLNGLSPNAVFTGAGETVIDLFGSSFFPGAIVYWDGDPLTGVYINSGHLRITVPEDALKLAGSRTVLVANPDPTTGVSGTRQFVIGGNKTYLPAISR